MKLAEVLLPNIFTQKKRKHKKKKFTYARPGRDISYGMGLNGGEATEMEDGNGEGNGDGGDGGGGE